VRARGVISTEDKAWWVIHGRDLEERFVNNVLPMLGLRGKINPEKETNPYAPDLIVEDHLADLKCQRAPFFTAGRLGLDPQHAVTFNHKDYVRYSKEHSSLDIFFWVNWQVLADFGVRVEPLNGVWRGSFPAMRFSINCGKVPLHEYRHRVDDRHGNAKSSYVFDVRRFEALG